jgi:hypothetical protein
VDEANHLSTQARAARAAAQANSLRNTLTATGKRRAIPAPSPYILYCMEKREEVKQMYPNANFTEIGRTLGQLWSQLPESEKAVSTP